MEWSLFVGGPVLLIGGILAAAILWTATGSGPGRAMPTLPVGRYTAYSFAVASASATPLDNTLVIVFLGIAGLGLFVLAIALIRRSRRRLVMWLAVTGALLTAGGVIGGLVAKRVADVAFVAASSSTRLVTAPSNPLALTFAPTRTHGVAPDYTGFWIGMIVAAFGALALVGAVIVRRRSAAQAPGPDAQR